MYKYTHTETYITFGQDINHYYPVDESLYYPNEIYIQGVGQYATN